ncbi:MAG: flagellar biosynthesis anti-sigma factor FlgM [Proteobacteria bacterium]|nr:flagellar biosynthesis anti-sigma factor FlgM [Pseudomonadota bacterium]MBU4297949.1 flagellar biosynthesis anti-sigma factor FlgM [Pseudomonadota bacterium]MCG2746056.1 flagellar biosynthesis anti-sigma factor FlgM [Desulfobulbaceae bacterium]
MKLTDAISQIRTDNKVEVKKTRKLEGGPEGASPSAADTVDLSSSSRDVQKMKEILDQTPAMRMEMIESLKKQIDEGTYQVDARDIADKMMDDLLSANQLPYK